MADKDEGGIKMVIGVVSEPGEDANQFVFVTPDDTELKTGEFVKYEASVELEHEREIKEKKRRIFARVINREQCRGFPDRFMSNPDVPPKLVARKLGISSEETDLYRIKAVVIGYYDERLNDFTNPRIVPNPGTEIELATNDELEEFLTEASSDAGGTALIGELLHRSPGETEISLPIDAFTSTHLSILASTGSGKSYTAAVIAEEMMKPDSKAAMLIIDPHGEYGTLKEIEERNQDIFQDADEGYSPSVQIWSPEDIKIQISELTQSDLFSILDNPSDAQEQVLSEAWDNLQNKDNEYISLEEIKEECASVGDSMDLESSARALDWRLEKALNRDLFHHSKHISLSSNQNERGLLRPGQCTVLRLDTMGLRDQQMLTTVLLRKINQARIEAEKGRESELDFPVFVMLEEGHRFAPADGSARSLGVLSTILSEGRKFGVGIGIISQRPSKIDDDVLSQCKTQIIMQIKNPTDQEAVRRSVEGVGEDLLSELPGLTPGQAVVSGDSVNTPFLCRIRERHTEHGAESLETTRIWREEWQKLDREPDGLAEPEVEEGTEDRDETL
ncbi:hypothetical protein AKJ52_01335 [candidate division MSBL1 archaeon SCGC-AAA382C18]|uniref:Helicase HerA central domain-containing protein n=1 Tax=candidate division MSBL1 archaeon SCGC-AAA382C18 TaxID=1698281 RepID=A0A133VKB9_9EURY|nr:hypothetical protein AKJ52_01335 [candidate division MSBL1 archaeon SCGC-AAA382C18]